MGSVEVMDLAGSTVNVCVRCVMDDTDPNIDFDADGRCNHCRRADALHALLPRDDEEASRRLDRLASTVRSPRARYDCVVGLSGGLDSSYVALLAHEMGLRVLVVHFDNGWNSEIAVSNIEQICDRLGHALVTYVINWPEFRDLQRAFLLASVVDLELVSDQAIFAAMLHVAKEHDVAHVLSGTNLATEAILPEAWVWPKQDLRNIRAIHRRFGTVPLRTYPTCGIVRWGLVRYARWGPTYHEVLNAARYRRTDAERRLTESVGWRSYGGKHEESVITRFYQRVLLPEKFGIDKRRAHLSSLIVNGEIARELALEHLATPPCTPDERAEDLTYVGKKLGFTTAELESIINADPIPHDAYPSSARAFRLLSRVRDPARRRALELAGGA